MRIENVSMEDVNLLGREVDSIRNMVNTLYT